MAFSDIVIAFFLVSGGLLTFLGSLGIVKLPDFYARLHGPAKNTTLGMGGILLASAIFFSTTEAGLTIRDFLITVFLFMTAPISAHLLAKAALHLDVPFYDHQADGDEEQKPSDRITER